MKNYKNYKYTEYTTDDITHFIHCCMCQGVAMNYYNSKNPNEFIIAMYYIGSPLLKQPNSEIYKNPVIEEAIQVLKFTRNKKTTNLEVIGKALKELPRETMESLLREVCASIDSILLEVHGESIDDELCDWMKYIN